MRRVISGRAHALTKPLQESEGLGDGELENGMSEVMEMLLEVRLTTGGVNEEEAAVMQKSSLQGD